MVRKALIFVFMALFLASLVFAASQPEDEIYIPFGDNATASMPVFSYSFIRIHEGSRLNFNVVDPATGIDLVRNQIIIQEIGVSETRTLLSLDGGELEEFILVPGEEYNLTYDYEFLENIILEQKITRYSDNREERNIVLFFEVPFSIVAERMKSQANSRFSGIDNSIISSNSGKDSANPLVIVLGVIILILILVLAYINFKRFRKK